jgi:hypothetical protein
MTIDPLAVQALKGQLPPEHSPTPWTEDEDGVIVDANGVGIALAGSRVPGDRELICRAVNNHEPLLDALRAFCGDHESTGFDCAGLNAAYLHAKMVIAKAEGR